MNSPLLASHILLIGRQIFDGADAEQLAQRFGVSTDAINQTWLECRECLSQHFAEQDKSDYRLLTDNDLKGRALDTIRLLLDWHQSALHLEQILQETTSSTKPDSTDEYQPEDGCED